MRLIDADVFKLENIPHQCGSTDKWIRWSDLLKFIDNFSTVKGDITDDYMDGWDDAIDAIRTRKFEIEPWQGEWIGAGFLTSKCSRCHHLFHELEAMNFCPNCGADMRG